MIVTAYNPDTDNLERTYLSASHQAGATTLNVKNNNNIVTSRRILIGEMGHERSEIKTTGSPTGVTQVGITAGLSFAHDPDDPIMVLDFDQIAFYRSSTINGTYSLVTTVTIDVDNADGMTRYDDTLGTDSDFYKIKYVNSLSLEDTEFSDPIEGNGFAGESAGKVIDEVVRRVRDQSYSVLGVQEYLDIMNEVNDDLITQTRRPFRFLRTSQPIDTIQDQNYVPLPDNLWKFDRVSFRDTIGGNTREYGITPLLLRIWERKYDNTYWTPSDQLMDVAIDEETNRLYLGPTPRTALTGKIQLRYYKTFDKITDVGDIVETPNTLIYKYKMLSEYYNAKSEADNQFARLAAQYEQRYGAEVVKMQRVNGVDVGTTKEIKPLPGTWRRRFTL